MIAVRVNPVSKKLKKSQPIQVSHIGPGNILNVMIAYVTVGNYERVLDYYTACGVAKALEKIEEGEEEPIKVIEKGVSLIVKLR